MKLSIRLFIGYLISFGLSGAFSPVLASPALVSSSEATKYSQDALGPSIFLKWPRGSLIFPETNDPEKTNDVFLLTEISVSEQDLQALHYHLGLQFFSRGEYSKAKKEYLEALKFKAAIPAIYKNLGLIYFSSKNYKGAEKAYRKALQMDPGYTTVTAKLALSLAAQKKYSLAEKEFKKAIRAEPSNAEYHLNLGHFYYYLKKNYRGAKRSYQKALKFNPRLVKAKINLSEINLKFRKWKNRESDFENSWGSDYDYDSSKNKNNSPSIPSYPEEADIAGTWDEENSQHPLF